MSDSGDILIRGKKMPVTCCHCPLMGYDPDIEWNDGGRETQGAYICVITHELIDNTKREDHCPLILVPPHGRLIDVAVLWVEINKICDRRDAGIITDLTCVQQLLSAVRHAPTIIPAELEEEGET